MEKIRGQSRHPEQAVRDAERAREGALEFQRRAMTFQIKFGDLLDIPRQGFVNSLLGFFRYMNAWTRAVLLGHAMPRSKAAPAGSRAEGFDPYAALIADFHTVFLTEEQLETYMALRVAQVTKGGTEVFA